MRRQEGPWQAGFGGRGRGSFKQNSPGEALTALPGAEEAALGALGCRPPAAGRRWAGGVLTSPVRGHCGASELSPEPASQALSCGGDKPSTARSSLQTARCSLTLIPCQAQEEPTDFFFLIKKINEKFIYKFSTLGYKSISYTQECAATSSS